VSERLASQIARLMEVLRALPLQKAPGVAETIDWAMALMVLHSGHLDRATLEQTLGCVLKLHDDQIVVRDHREAIDAILGTASTELPAGGYGLQTDFGFGSVSTPRRAPES